MASKYGKHAKLVRVSKEATGVGLKHLLLTVNDDNIVRIDSSTSIVQAFAANPGQFDNIKTFFMERQRRKVLLDFSLFITQGCHFPRTVLSGRDLMDFVLFSGRC